jgi:alkanesulfonate monooxygenase SsuD/methylene tetrahydromethanopterin reductase-like flavin-dependent oxidoreductase (luciferase family)
VIKAGVLAWNQYTDWPSLEHIGSVVDELGYDSLWTWDHVYPIVGDHRGPMFEGYLTLTAWAYVTKRVTLGLMVGANTFRNPALVAKMATTLDHISGGRAVLGIGGAWFETEHTAFGIPFGSGFGERLNWLDEAVELMRGMLHQEETSARGRYYHAKGVRNDPPPVQRPLPILIAAGASGRRLRRWRSTRTPGTSTPSPTWRGRRKCCGAGARRSGATIRRSSGRSQRGRS